MRLVHLGIIDEREGFDMPMTAATRVMRHMSAVVMRLWVMYDKGYVFFKLWVIKLSLKNAFLE